VPALWKWLRITGLKSLKWRADNKVIMLVVIMQLINPPWTLAGAMVTGDRGLAELANSYSLV
jgi:hypothetical protein